MKSSKFTNEQITFALRHAEIYSRMAEVCRKRGVSESTFYFCKKKYGSLGVVELGRLKQFEEENCSLKRMVAGFSFDKQMLQDAIFQEIIKSALKCRLVYDLDMAYREGARRACTVLKFSRASYYYCSIKFDDPVLRRRILEIAQARIRFGFQRIYYMLLRREGWQVNNKSFLPHLLRGRASLGMKEV